MNHLFPWAMASIAMLNNQEGVYMYNSDLTVIPKKINQ